MLVIVKWQNKFWHDIVRSDKITTEKIEMRNNNHCILYLSKQFNVDAIWVVVTDVIRGKGHGYLLTSACDAISFYWGDLFEGMIFSKIQQYYLPQEKTTMLLKYWPCKHLFPYL